RQAEFYICGLAASVESDERNAGAPEKLLVSMGLLYLKELATKLNDVDKAKAEVVFKLVEDITAWVRTAFTQFKKGEITRLYLSTDYPAIVERINSLNL
ncbi:hypothetical protein IT397_01210, partial [Candidatus Nomurabacteria bacterium]|nr:hypothetical protein [Candidatus Nomurabacteria bacterium]